MTCVATQDEVIETVTSWIGGLSTNVKPRDKETLSKIADLWAIGVAEILSGGLTPESCLKMSRMLITAEEKASRRVLNGGDQQDLWMFEGLKRIHDKMQLFVTEDANEGNKDCCPMCSC